MLLLTLEALTAIVAAVGMLQAVAWAAHGYKNKQREPIGKRLGRRREDSLSTRPLSIQAQVERSDPAKEKNDEQYPAEPTNK